MRIDKSYLQRESMQRTFLQTALFDMPKYFYSPSETNGNMVIVFTNYGSVIDETLWNTIDKTEAMFKSSVRDNHYNIL
jgi:hypothetical protein